MLPREPWAYGERAEEIFRLYDELRYRLTPYIYTGARVWEGDTPLERRPTEDGGVAFGYDGTTPHTVTLRLEE